MQKWKIGVFAEKRKGAYDLDCFENVAIIELPYGYEPKCICQAEEVKS